MLLALLALSIGCGSEVCSGTRCVCLAGESCNFGFCASPTDSCSFTCNREATCTGSCGPDCRVVCDGKSCTHVVGLGSSVACNVGICNITCSGSCAVSGQANVTCQGGTKTEAGCI